MEGVPSTCYTDHKPLTQLQQQPHISRRQARWLGFLAGFHPHVVYVQGSYNPADVLSRPPRGPNCTPSQARTVETNSVTRVRRSDLEGTPIRSQYVNVPDTSHPSRQPPLSPWAPSRSQPIHGCGPLRVPSAPEARTPREVVATLPGPSRPSISAATQLCQPTHTYPSRRLR